MAWWLSALISIISFAVLSGTIALVWALYFRGEPGQILEYSALASVPFVSLEVTILAGKRKVEALAITLAFVLLFLLAVL